ncbi:MAG: hypothetical protein ACJAZ2_002135 [Glaciecola sp.]|jgi:hypothetical protein
MRPIRVYSLLIIGLFIPLGIQGQSIVNTESLYSNDTAKTTLILQPGIDIQGGNTNVFELFGIASFIQRFSSKTALKAHAGYDLLKGENKVILSDHFGQVRISQSLHKQIDLFGVTQFQTSKNLLLNNRFIYGTGLRFKFFHNDSNDVLLDYSIGAFQELENLDANAVGDVSGYHNKLRTNVTRLSTFLVFKYEVTERLSFVNTVYYQPMVDRFSDFRMLNELDIGIQINKVLSLNINYVYRYDSSQPDVLKSVDYFLTSGIVVNFVK